MPDKIRLDQLSKEELQKLEEELLNRQKQGLNQQIDEVADSIYVATPVSVPEFIESPEFMGIRNVYPGIMDLLIRVDSDDIHEFYLNIGKGSGKSVFCSLILARENYKDLNLKNPQRYYNQMDDSPIVSLNMSLSEKHAKRILFRYYLTYLKKAKWFREKYERVGSEVHFAHNVMGVCGHSRSTSFLGYNTRVGVCDEADWFMSDDNKDQATEIFDVMMDSAKTRYIDKYKIGAISASGEPTGFMATRYKQVKEDSLRLHAEAQIPIEQGGM